MIRRQHKALATEDTYVRWLRHYLAALSQMPHALSSEQKVERFLTELALKRDVAASTQNQAFNAIAFFYKDVLAIRCTTWTHFAPRDLFIRAMSPR